jgi:HK97 family phage major capsid protein
MTGDEPLRRKLLAESQALLDHAAEEHRDLTPTESRRFDTLLAAAKRLEDPSVIPSAPDPVPPVPPDVSTDSQYLDMVRGQFRLTRMLAGAAGLPNVDWGLEKEVLEECAKRAGRSFQGYAVPMQVFEKRVVTTTLPTAGPGSNVIATDLLSGQFIDRLRAALRVRQLGATVLTGLVGNVAIPKLKGSATSAWVAENAGLSASDIQLEQVTLAPKHVGALTEYSRNMLMQASPDIEEILRNDFARTLAAAVDSAAIKGGGSNEPVGILATSGIGDVPGGAQGLAPTWANVIALTGAVEQADAGEGTGFLTNYKVTAKMRGTVRVGSTDSRMIMEERASLAGYPLVATSLVPSNITKGTQANCSALIFGDFSELLLGYWSELDVLVNPYETTAYTKGNVQIRAFVTCDVKLRHAASFAATQDLITT